MAKPKEAEPKKAAVKKVTIKKAAPSKNKANTSGKKESTSAQQPVRIIIEVFVRKETSLVKTQNKNFEDAFSLQEVQQMAEPNFEFKFTIANGVQLARIDIDGFVFDREKLEEASKTDADGKLVVAVFANVRTTPVSMIIDAVGEPNRVATFTLKFNKKDVYKDDDPQKIKIEDSRRGKLSIAEVNLP